MLHFISGLCQRGKWEHYKWHQGPRISRPNVSLHLVNILFILLKADVWLLLPKMALNLHLRAESFLFYDPYFLKLVLFLYCYFSGWKASRPSHNNKKVLKSRPLFWQLQLTDVIIPPSLVITVILLLFILCVHVVFQACWEEGGEDKPFIHCHWGMVESLLVK